MKILLLNSPILTAPGEYEYKLISEEAAANLIKSFGFESAVGHASTAEIMSTLFGTEIPMNRIQALQKPSQLAIIFRLKTRPAEGKVYSADEIKKLGYEIGLLTRKK